MSITRLASSFQVVRLLALKAQQSSEQFKVIKEQQESRHASVSNKEEQAKTPSRAKGAPKGLSKRRYLDEAKDMAMAAFVHQHFNPRKRGREGQQQQRPRKQSRQ